MNSYNNHLHYTYHCNHHRRCHNNDNHRYVSNIFIVIVQCPGRTTNVWPTKLWGPKTFLQKSPKAKVPQCASARVQLCSAKSKPFCCCFLCSCSLCCCCCNVSWQEQKCSTFVSTSRIIDKIFKPCAAMPDKATISVKKCKTLIFVKFISNLCQIYQFHQLHSAKTFDVKYFSNESIDISTCDFKYVSNKNIDICTFIMMSNISAMPDRAATAMQKRSLWGLWQLPPWGSKVIIPFFCVVFVVVVDRCSWYCCCDDFPCEVLL